MKIPAANSGLAQAGVTCFVGTFVLNLSFRLRRKFSGKNPRLRQAAKR